MKLTSTKTNVTAPSADYPYGDIKNNSGVGDGTPVDREFLTDYVQFFERMMNLSGLTANNLSDNNSDGFQLYEAFRRITGPYNSYVATLTQTGTSAPVATIMGYNNIGAIVWSRVSAGVYRGTLTGAFAGSRTWVSIMSSDTSNRSATMFRGSVNYVEIRTFSAAGTPADLVLGVTPIEIRIYDA